MHKLNFPVSQVLFSFNNQSQPFLNMVTRSFSTYIISSLFTVVYFIIFSQVCLFEIHIKKLWYQSYYAPLMKNKPKFFISITCSWQMTYPNNITDLYQPVCQIQSLGLPLERCARSQSFTFIYFKEKVLTVLHFILFLHIFLKKVKPKHQLHAWKAITR